jgi:hypothetical protein
MFSFCNALQYAFSVACKLGQTRFDAKESKTPEHNHDVIRASLKVMKTEDTYILVASVIPRNTPSLRHTRLHTHANTHTRSRVGLYWKLETSASRMMADHTHTSG